MQNTPQEKATKTIQPGIRGWLAFSCFSISLSIAVNSWLLYQEVEIGADIVGDALRTVLLFEFWVYPLIILSGCLALVNILKKRAGKVLGNNHVHGYCHWEYHNYRPQLGSVIVW